VHRIASFSPEKFRVKRGGFFLFLGKKWEFYALCDLNRDLNRDIGVIDQKQGNSQT
jgi:hypothetical protein